MKEFEEACSEEYQKVRRFLLRLCGNETLAEELTQETFYQAMRQWKRFKHQCAVSTWLCGIAKRLYFSYCRKPPPIPVPQAPEQSSEDFVEHLLDKERRLQAHRLLHQLPEPYKEVMTLRTFGDLSHREIAALFDKPESWSRMTYYRAKQMLIGMMKGEEWNES